MSTQEQTAIAPTASRDSLGDRMKSSYEDRTRYLLPRRTHTILRLDGKSFHTLTRGYAKPFDERITMAMTNAAMSVVAEAQGAKLAYIQSDEISILLTDFDTINTDAWFGGNVQKIASVSASIASVQFNFPPFDGSGAVFDARVFTIPDPEEVVNYFIWRQKDAIRNSVQSCAQALFSSKQLHEKKQQEMLTMIAGTGRSWETELTMNRRGFAVVRVPVVALDGTADPRWSWTVDMEVPVFTEDRGYVRSRIPVCA